MKTLSLFIGLLVMSASLQAQTPGLAGKWQIESSPATRPLRFVDVEGAAYTLTTERFVTADGKLAYKVDQATTLELGSDSKVSGTVSFFDSRGCSFPDLEVKGSLQGERLTLLMTIPRYKVMSVSSGPLEGYYAPRYCEYQGPVRYGSHPTSYRYVCGRRFIKPQKRILCDLIETVQVPVELVRKSL